MKHLTILFSVISVLWFSGCSEECQDCPDLQGYVPAAPEYEDSEMWVSYLNDADGTGADVFYVPSTWEFDWCIPCPLRMVTSFCGIGNIC